MMSHWIKKIVLLFIRFAAKRKLARIKPTVIAVTGSIGKSTCLSLLDAVLHDTFKTRTTTKGNSETGLPLEILGIRDELTDYRMVTWVRILFHVFVMTIFGDDDSYDILIAEFGIDSPYTPKNMEYLLTLIPYPDIAILLSLAPVHTEQFAQDLPSVDQQKESVILERIAYQKMLLAKAVTKQGTAILQADTPLFTNEIPHIKGSVVTVGRKQDATFHIRSVSATIKEGSTIMFVYNKKSYTIHFPHIIAFPETASTIASVIAASLSLGVPIQTSIERLQKISRFPPGRFSLLKGIKQSIIIDSSYNASPDSVKAALLFLKTAVKKKGRRIAILGDMRELGPLAKKKHEEIAECIIDTVDHVVCVGPLMKEFVVPTLLRRGFQKQHIDVFETAEGVGIFMRSYIQPDDVVLVKGSQNTIYLEQVVEELLLTKDDINLLCRQSAYWNAVRKEFFSSHPNTLYDPATVL